jgi:nickel/cobalt transporter (NicO) family protein
MAAYLVGHPGHSYRDVFFLAATITLTHTGLIYLLGFIFLYFDHTHTLSSILPYFQHFGNFLIIILGLWLIWRGIKELIHHHRHEHHLDHTHKNRSSLFLAGFSGGLVPCPDAFAIFIFFTSKGQISFGLISIVLFSLGLSATIVGLGLALLFGKRTFNLENRLGPLVETYIPLVVGLILILLVLFGLKT